MTDARHRRRVLVLSVLVALSVFAGMTAARDDDPKRVHSGNLVFQGEDVTLGGQLESQLEGYRGPADGELLTTPVPQDQPVGLYSNDGRPDSPGVAVATPRITGVDVHVFSRGRDTGRDADGATISPADADDLRVTAEFNFSAAEPVVVAVEDSAGRELTDRVLDTDVGDGDELVERSGRSVGIDLAGEGPGEYTITVAGVDDLDFGDARRTTTVTLRRPPTPVARCSVSDTEVEPGEQVVVDASESAADSVRFDLDGDEDFDRTNREDFREAVSYAESGTVTPVVRAAIEQRTDTRSCPTVTVNRPPTAVIDSPSDDLRVGESVVLDASGSDDPDGEIVEYRWDVNDDGSPDRVTAAASTEHTFDEADSHRVSLRVVDDDGAVGEFRTTIRVVDDPLFPWVDVIIGTAGGLLGLVTLREARSRWGDDDGEDDEDNRPPRATVTYTPEEPVAGRPVSFDGSPSVDPDPEDDVDSYRWTVEDREAGTPRLVHTFEEAGEYDVRLEVDDGRGGTDEWTETIAVEGEGELAVGEIHPDTPGDDHENTHREYVAFENDGDGALDLAGWTVHDAAEEAGRVTEGEHTFEFPEGCELEPGATVAVHTGSEPDVPDYDETSADRHLFWDREWAVWNNEEDVVVVTDDTDHPVAAVRYERTDAGEYDRERIDPAALEDWFPDAAAERREEAPPSEGASDRSVLEAAVSDGVDVLAGAAFLRGLRSFVASWAVIAGFLFAALVTWGVATSIGGISRSIPGIVPLLLLLLAVFVVLVGGVVLVAWWAVSTAWDWLA